MPDIPIPEDIREKARSLAEEWADTYLMEGAEEAIAAALLAERMAERERCAKIAEGCGDTWSNSRDVSQAVAEAAVDDKAEEIARSIREQKP